MASVITLDGIDQAISNLNYKNMAAIKYRFVHTIRQFYTNERSIESIEAIDTDELIKRLWETGDSKEKIRNRRKNLNSIKSSVNTDLKKRFSEGKNPEGIIIGRTNIFEMSEDAKDKVLKEFGFDLKPDGTASLSQIMDILKAASKTLSNVQPIEDVEHSEDIGKVDQLSNLIQNLSEKISSISKNVSDENIHKTEKEENEDFIGDEERDKGLGSIETDDVSEASGGVGEPLLDDVEDTEAELEELDDVEDVNEEDVIEEVDDVEEEMIDEIDDADDIDPEHVWGDEEIALEDVLVESEEDVIEAVGGAVADGGDNREGESRLRLEDGDDSKGVGYKDDGGRDGLDGFGKDESEGSGGGEGSINAGGDKSGRDVLGSGIFDSGEGGGSEEKDGEEPHEGSDIEEGLGLKDEERGKGLGPIETDDVSEASGGVGEPLLDEVEDTEAELEEPDDVEDVNEEGVIEEVDDVEEDVIDEIDDVDDEAELEELDDVEDVNEEDVIEEVDDVEEDVIDEIEDVDDEVILEELDDIEVDETFGDTDDIDTEAVETDVDADMEDEIGDADDIDPKHVWGDEEIALEGTFDDEDEIVEEVDELVAGGADQGTDKDSGGALDEYLKEKEADHHVEVGLPVDSLGSEHIDEMSDKIKKARLLAEEFDGLLGAMDRHYNQYISIPGGKYIVGSSNPNKDERAEQFINLPSFYIGRFPVTNGLFEIFVEKTGYKTTAEKIGYGNVYNGRIQKKTDERTGIITSTWNASISCKIVEGACWYQPSGPGSTLHNKRTHPVVQISLEDAMAFAAWTGKRLPTEGEWEAASRTEKGLIFPWGNSWERDSCNNEKNGLGDTTPVDQYVKYENNFGVADTLGNVSEWIWDGAEYVAGNPNHIRYFIGKGGSWISGDDIKLFSRFRLDSESHSNILGFRCVAD